MILPKIKYLSLVFVLLALNGCAKYHGAATIVTVPPGAQVIDLKDDSVIGVTPLTVHWEDSARTRRYVALELKKAGFKDEVSHFWVSMRHKSKTSAVDAGDTVKVEMKAP